jgi:hypothetical protein
MISEPDVSGVGRVIQLSVAPVFLVAGVSGLLNVLTSRLGRLIDRARVIEGQIKARGDIDEAEARARLEIFSRRARLISAAISLCTACASMICLVVMALFAGAFLGVDLSKFIALAFVAAMTSLFIALICFLREVLIATRALRIGVPQRIPGSDKPQPLSD